MNKQKGFTIIELIIVIAIIAVLAAIVLVNVTGYVNRATDAGIKGNMSNMITNAAIYFERTPTGHGDDYLLTLIYSAADAATMKANGNNALVKFGSATEQIWCSCSKLVVTSGNTFCVDSTGYKKETAGTCATRCTTAAPNCAEGTV